MQDISRCTQECLSIVVKENTSSIMYYMSLYSCHLFLFGVEYGSSTDVL